RTSRGRLSHWVLSFTIRPDVVGPMLIVRAPVRVSFAGGGTDLPEYYEQFGGLVVSTTIDRYFYVFVSLNGADSVQVTSSDYRTFFRQRRGQVAFWDGDLALP